MLTEKINISKETPENTRETIRSYQKLYSVGLRKMHSNMDLLVDESFVKDVTDNYIFSAKNYEYLVKEVETRYKKEASIKENTREEIKKLTKEIKDEEKKKKERNLKKIKRLQRKVSRKLASLNKNITFGTKAIMRDITKQSQALMLLDPVKDKEKYEKKAETLAKSKAKFKEERIVMMCFQGDSAHHGSRMFDFKGLSKGEITFKYNGEKFKLNFKITSKRQAKLLEKLEFMALEKQIPLAIGISNNEVHITYEEGKLNGKFFDKKAFYKSIKHIKDEGLRKETIAKAYKEHEARCFSDKLPNRAINIDPNPGGIGYSIIDRISDNPDGAFKIVRLGFYDFSELEGTNVSSDKRRYEISIAIRDMFEMAEYYKAFMFIDEDRDMGNPTDHGNKTSNRKINNVWLRTLVDQLVNKWCAFYGMKKIPVHPEYSSFIGNINYDIFDPIAASLELGRRGITKFFKGSHWVPAYHKGVITESMLHGDVGKMDFNKLQNASSWKEAYSLVSTAKMSVRRADKSVYPFQQFKQNRTDKSLVKHLVFFL